MRTLMIALLIVLTGCTGNLKSGLTNAETQELNKIRDKFFNQHIGSEELASLDTQSLPKIDSRRHAQDYFQCSNEHKDSGNIAYQTLTIEFEEMELRDALVEISIITEIPILMDDSVEGTVAGNFQNEPLHVVLETLLSVGEFDYRVFQKHVFVGSTETSSPSYHQLSTTCIYRPNYLDAFSLVSLLPEFYQRFIKINKQNGFIGITATGSMMHRIQHDIVLFDIPQKQIVMELSIVEVSTEALEILGLDWQSIKNKTGSVYDRSLATSYSGRTVALPTLKAQHFLSAVNALKNSGKADIKTMPSIVVLEGKEAKFKSMQTTWTPEVMATSHKKEAIVYGVEMNVIPFINNLGGVQLNIKSATVSDFITDISGLPKVVKHSLSSSVTIADGESLIIGGLLQKKNRQQASGIPMLKDIPLLGGLFNNDIKIMKESEVLIILQPRILRG